MCPMPPLGCGSNAEAAMRNGVFLDTSFLITLADPGHDRHAVAKRFYQEFLTQRMPLAVSAIVVAEFCVRQSLATLPLQQLILIPFTHEDAVVAASLDFKRFQQPGRNRQALRDDLKVIGHAKARNFGYLITDDADTMFAYCEELRRGGILDLRAIKLQSGFSLEPFTADGQGDFIQVMEEQTEYRPATPT
jgi:predicted nucleic acid-binding protein